MAVRMLKRKAELGGGAAAVPPPCNASPGGAPLPLPPRSRTFVDQAVREREDGRCEWGGHPKMGEGGTETGELWGVGGQLNMGEGHGGGTYGC